MGYIYKDTMPNPKDERTRLVATRLPEGFVLYETPGVSADADRLLEFARRSADCPAEIKAARAVDVGLEWHFQGHKQPWNDAYQRKGFFCVLTPTKD